MRKARVRRLLTTEVLREGDLWLNSNRSLHEVTSDYVGITLFDTDTAFFRIEYLDGEAPKYLRSLTKPSHEKNKST